MKNHSRIGFKTLNVILMRYPKALYLKMSAEIAISHHEKFDGTHFDPMMVVAFLACEDSFIQMSERFRDN